ncbi:MAG TPA: hypothetical protein PLQ36_03480, partial [Candidatus Gracilibacteria bacterium]|nr:hypothetical protein [Candidatus Gracilibacteria bacterium]
MYLSDQNLQTAFAYFGKAVFASEIQSLRSGQGKLQTNPHSQKLWEKVRKWSWIWTIIPGIKAVFIGNSVAMQTSHPESDIDVFIICFPEQIWIARFFSTTILLLLKLL